VLPPYRRRFEDVDKTLHELWIQGFSTRDFEPSLRALLGQATPLSPSTISRVNKQFHDEYKTWCKRPVANKFVYLWADGVYLGAGPNDERRVMLVVMGVDLNGDKALLAIDDAFAESEESWAGVFESLRERGLKDVALLVRRRRRRHLVRLQQSLPSSEAAAVSQDAKRSGQSSGADRGRGAR